MAHVTSKTDADGFLYLPGSPGNIAYAAGVGPMGINGDHTHRWSIAPDDWGRSIQCVASLGGSSLLIMLGPWLTTHNYFQLWWTDVGTGLIRTASTAIFVRPAPGVRTWWALTFDKISASGGSSIQLFQSTDRGQTYVAEGAPTDTGAGITTTNIDIAAGADLVLGGPNAINEGGYGEQFVGKLYGYSIASGWKSGPVPQDMEDDEFRFDGFIDLADLPPETVSFPAHWNPAHVVTVNHRQNVTSIDFPGPSGNAVTTPHFAAGAIAGDLSLLVGIRARTYTPTVQQVLLSKLSGGTNTRSWRLRLQPTGVLHFSWSPDGNAVTDDPSNANLSALAPGSLVYVLAQKDVVNGANRVTKFWTSTDLINWTQLGTDVTQVGNAAFYTLNTTIPFVIGGQDSGVSANNFDGEIILAAIYSGLVGPTELANGTAPVFLHSERTTGLDFDATTLDAPTGQDLTVLRSGAPATRLIMGVNVAYVSSPGYGIEWIPEVRERRPAWSVDLCREWQRIGIAESFDFSGTARRNAMGDFLLNTTLAGVSDGFYVSPYSGLVDKFDPRDVDTIRLVAEGRIVMSCYVGGPPGGTAGAAGGFSARRDADGERWSWSGVDAWLDLRTRLAFPDPTENGPPWSITHDTRTGIASTVIAAYINANMGTGSLADRDYGSIAVTDEFVGESDTWTARLQPLDGLVSRIARDSGIEILPEVGFDGVLRILLTTGRNLTGFVVLSDQGDLLASDARFVPTAANWTLSGGSGEGVSRIFRKATAGMTGRKRREQFSDQSGFASAGEVDRDAVIKNALAGESEAIMSELTDVQARDAIQLGLRLGDVISIIINGRKYAVPIEAVQFDISAAKQSMRPLLGTAIPDAFATLLESLDSLGPRFDNSIA